MNEWVSEWVNEWINKWRHSLNSWLQLFWTSVQQSQAKRMSAKTTHSPAALLDSIYALQQTPTLHLKHNSIIDMYWPRFKPLMIINTHLSALYYKRRQQKLTLWWHHDQLSDCRFDLTHKLPLTTMSFINIFHQQTRKPRWRKGTVGAWLQCMFEIKIYNKSTQNSIIGSKNYHLKLNCLTGPPMWQTGDSI